jgi:photosystem II stability/assembly factor-like uncharacterized protein
MLLANLFVSSLFAQSGWYSVFANSSTYLQSNFFTDANTGYAVGIKYGPFPIVLKTTNAGVNWIGQSTPQEDSVNFFYRWVFFTDMNTGFIAIANLANVNIGRILKTTNGGNNWFNTPLPVDYHMTTVFFINSITGYACGRQTILKTTNSGESWMYQDPGVSYYLFGICFTDANSGYVVGNAGTILKTTNGGNNWNQLNSGTGQYLWGLYFADTNTGVAVGGSPNNTENIILRTTNAGNNWSVIPYSGSSCLLWSVRFVNSSTGWITGWCGQVVKTTNGGLSWYNQIVPVIDFRTSFFTSANTGYAVAEFYGSVWKTTDGGGSFVAVDPVETRVPSGFLLYQNYPNPFNPATKIRFDIPPYKGGQGDVPPLYEKGEKGGFVTLKVYEALGREAAILVNQRLSAGTYEVEWNASNYAGGVYYYKLSTDNYSETKKMILIK